MDLHEIQERLHWQLNLRNPDIEMLRMEFMFLGLTVGIEAGFCADSVTDLGIDGVQLKFVDSVGVFVGKYCAKSEWEARAICLIENVNIEDKKVYLIDHRNRAGVSILDERTDYAARLSLFPSHVRRLLMDYVSGEVAIVNKSTGETLAVRELWPDREDDIDPRLLHVLMTEVKTQCHSALAMYERFDRSLKDRLLDESFMFAHAVLNHAANVSKLLLPDPRFGNRESREKKRIRGDSLRRELKIRGDEVYLDRDLRNHLEHFDERLDSWAEGIANGGFYFVDRNIGFDNESARQGKTLRHINPTTREMIFATDSVNMIDLFEEINELLTRCIRWLSRHSVF